MRQCALKVSATNDLRPSRSSPGQIAACSRVIAYNLAAQAGIPGASEGIQPYDLCR
jgi:hypothetical protein